ncbi:recombinase family protein [Mechercharimyces sp. CAU 1602]|uniref:recombinase family protein n=1 Tax=Mechercharimyces sp. CAU 1602 TaxID=2973933 RepID=UPI002161D1AF|nr:recombinase family protein [Mechercharimyces sp. CAU 1602]MCS1351689.1 recombinase family protein [Mechercharimyces sp. CAU 1602]
MRPTSLDCYIYLRKSRSDIEEEKKALSEGYTYDVLERHRSQLLDLAKNEEHNIIDIYEEVVSGEYLIDRPQIQRVLKLVEQGHCDAVLVMDLDRLGRGDMFDMGSIYRAFQYSDTLIITPTEVIDPSTDGAELLFGVKSILGREELKSITKRMQRGRHASAKEGKSISKKPPYGYLRDENLKLYPDPKTAWVIKHIFNRVIEGAGRQQIAQELDSMGVVPPMGEGLWCPSTISSMIKNEAYIGNIVWQKTKYTKRGGKYQQERLPREQWKISENAHEPLIPEEFFKRANESYSGRWRPPTKESSELSNPLAGVLVCKLCNRAIRRFPRKNRPNASLRCTYPGCKGKQKGTTFDLVEETIIDALKQTTNQYELKDDTDNNHYENTINIKEQAIKKYNSELKETKEQRNKLHDFLEKGIYDVDTFKERNQVLSRRIKKIEDQLDQIEQEIEEEKIHQKQKREVIPRLKSVLDAYRQTEEIREKNRLLKTVLEKVTYFRDPSWTNQGQFEIKLHLRIK